jgi:hypothetical protein
MRVRVDSVGSGGLGDAVADERFSVFVRGAASSAASPEPGRGGRDRPEAACPPGGRLPPAKPAALTQYRNSSQQSCSCPVKASLASPPATGMTPLAVLLASSVQD